jgi:hypothetical protein
MRNECHPSGVLKTDSYYFFGFPQAFQPGLALSARLWRYLSLNGTWLSKFMNNPGWQLRKN